MNGDPTDLVGVSIPTSTWTANSLILTTNIIDGGAPAGIHKIHIGWFSAKVFGIVFSDMHFSYTLFPLRTMKSEIFSV